MIMGAPRTGAMIAGNGARCGVGAWVPRHVTWAATVSVTALSSSSRIMTTALPVCVFGFSGSSPPVQQPVRFGPPRLVDNGEMPTDFLAWSRSGADGADNRGGRGSTVLVGREFNIMSTDDGETWRSSHPARPNQTFSSVIHFFPRQCPSNDCTEVTTIGKLNSSTGTAVAASPSYQFSLRQQINGSLAMVGARVSPKTSIFEGLPRPIKGFGLGGTTSLSLPNNRGFFLTAIVRWAPPYQPPCSAHASASASIIPCNRSSVVVFRSDTGTRWMFLSVLADSVDYPAPMSTMSRCSQMARHCWQSFGSTAVTVDSNHHSSRTTTYRTIGASRQTGVAHGPS